MQTKLRKLLNIYINNKSTYLKEILLYGFIYSKATSFNDSNVVHYFIDQLCGRANCTGGPVEQAIHEVESGLGAGRILGTEMYYQGAKGLSPEMVEQIKAQYRFDHPPVERFY